MLGVLCYGYVFFKDVVKMVVFLENFGFLNEYFLKNDMIMCYVEVDFVIIDDECFVWNKIVGVLKI